jgi:hypothetical protein
MDAFVDSLLREHSIFHLDLAPLTKRYALEVTPAIFSAAAPSFSFPVFCRVVVDAKCNTVVLQVSGALTARISELEAEDDDDDSEDPAAIAAAAAAAAAAANSREHNKQDRDKGRGSERDRSVSELLLTAAFPF